MYTVFDWSAGLMASSTLREAVPPQADHVCISPVNVPLSNACTPASVH